MNQITRVITLRALNVATGRFQAVAPNTREGRAILSAAPAIQVVIPAGSKANAMAKAIAGRINEFGPYIGGVSATVDANGDGTLAITVLGIVGQTAPHWAALIPVARGKRRASVKTLNKERWSQPSKVAQAFVTSFLPSGDDWGTEIARQNSQEALEANPYYRAVIRPILRAGGVR